MTKRYGMLVLTCALAFCMVFALCGCTSSQAYTPEEKTPTVSTPTIGKEGTLRVGVNASNAPFAGQNSGKIVGLDVDIAAALADSLGLKLEVVDIGSDIDGALEKGTVDIVMGVDKSDSSLSCWRSDVYIESGVSLFGASVQGDTTTASEGTFSLTSADSKVAAQTSSMSSWEVTNQFGQDALISTNDLKSAFAEVSAGTAEFVAADAVIGAYVAHTDNSDLEIVALMQNLSGYSVGVLDTNTELKTTISDAFTGLMENGVISIIEIKWLGTSLDLSTLPLTDSISSANDNSSDDGSDTVQSNDDESAQESLNETNDESTDSNSSLEAGMNAVQPS